MSEEQPSPNPVAIELYLELLNLSHKNCLLAVNEEEKNKAAQVFQNTWHWFGQNGVQLELDIERIAWIVSQRGPVLYVSFETDEGILAVLEKHQVQIEYLPRYIKVTFPDGTRKRPIEELEERFDILLPDGWHIVECPADESLDYSSILVSMD